MYPVGQFRIGQNARWIMLIDYRGRVIRRFSVDKFTMDDARLYREGYVKALNDARSGVV